MGERRAADQAHAGPPPFSSLGGALPHHASRLPPGPLAVSCGLPAGPTIGERAREINRFLRRESRFQGIANPARRGCDTRCR